MKSNTKGRRLHTTTIIKAKGIAKDANEKVTKTIIHQNIRPKKGRTLGDMVYESYPV